jgi:hypothetical protein
MKRGLAGIAVILAGVLPSGGQAPAQGVELGSGQSTDSIAWETLAAIAAPAGNPTTHTVEFETWASDQDIYEAAKPHWPVVNGPKKLQASGLRDDGQGAAGFHSLTIPTGGECFTPGNAKAGGFPPGACLGEEVRRNWASYQYIVSNGLYSFDGLERAFKSGLKVDLPADAVEFKGDWVKVADLITWIKRTEGTTLTPAEVRKTYYVNTATVGTTTDAYALVSIHLSSKQIKNWVWSDFEHRLNPGRCDTIGCHDSFGATDKDVAARAKANQNYGACQKTPALLAMMRNAGDDPVWENYCLKGSQATFVDSNGKATILGDSVVERINANIPIAKSSCITCHAYASFDKNGNFGLISTTTFHPPVGKIEESMLKGFRQNDFMWGIVRMTPRAQ